MGNSRIDAVALFLALLAGAFILGALHPYSVVTGIGGLIVLFVLFAYDGEGYRSGFQSLAFASVCGFALMLIAAAFLQIGAAANTAGNRIFQRYLPITWACATFIFTLIDRARMAGRFQASQGRHTLGIATAPPVPPPVRPETPVAQPEPFESRVAAESTTVEPVAVEPNTVEPLPAPAPPVGSDRAVPLPHRKETSIYINLVGEGLAVMRTVRAEHMGKDFYLITEPMPEGENWEFTTGQIVRCRKKNLSQGKGLVAVEEAPRAS